MRLSSIIALVAVLAFGQLSRADSYKLDPVHSFCIYRVAHMNVGYSYGQFVEPTGAVEYDAADPTKCSFAFMVDTNKLDTRNEKRDQHLKGPDFFNVKQFPEITFKSTSVKLNKEGKYEVSGELGMHGVTKSIMVTLDKTGEAATQMGYRIGWETNVDLKRSDFGINGLQGAIGDEVKLRISFETVKQP